MVLAEAMACFMAATAASEPAGAFLLQSSTMAFIFFGLVSSTLLDAFLTPILFHRFGKKEAELLVQNTNRDINF